MEPTLSKRLNEWIRRQCFTASPENPCRRLEICHVSPTGKTGQIISEIPVDFIQSEDIESLVSQIELDCVSDCEALGTAQKYVILAYFGESTKPSRRIILRIHPDEDGFDDTVESEPASKQGLLAQTMRHNEVMMKVATASTGNVIAMQNRVISHLEEQVKVLSSELARVQRKSMDLFSVMEDLQSQKQQRDLETYQAQTKAEVIREVGQKATLLLPAVINKLSGGKEVFKEKITPKEMMLREFAKSFKEEQLDTINAALRPEQQVVFNGLIEELLNQEIKEQEEKLKKESNGTS